MRMHPNVESEHCHLSAGDEAGTYIYMYMHEHSVTPHMQQVVGPSVTSAIPNDTSFLAYMGPNSPVSACSKTKLRMRSKLRQVCIVLKSPVKFLPNGTARNVTGVRSATHMSCNRMASTQWSTLPQ